MDKRQLFDALIAAKNSKEAQSLLKEFRSTAGIQLEEKPLGYRPNNRGTVDVATDPGRSVIERVTNAIDALLELEHHTHAGRPACSTPREAAHVWLGIDHQGLSSTSQKQRQQIARRTTVTLEEGEGRAARIVTIKDAGIGLHPENMGSTILSLNEGNKWQKHYLAGTFGQGGSSTFAFSKLTLIASRRYKSDVIGFTLIWYKDLPADQFKSGHYVFLTENDLPLAISYKAGDSLGPNGTLIRHFGYDLTNYPSPFGERSLYGAMNRLLFDPVAPIWFENKVEEWNRGIYGSRNRLNSGSDEAEGGNKLELAHRMPMISVGLGDIGQIGIEYWALLPPQGRAAIPTSAYVDHRKPIVLSLNGQNQSELSVLLIRKDAELPYLKSRLICHVDCDGLSSFAKRALFASTREQAKEGEILARIRQELVDVLRSDDDLKRLNREAKDKSLADTDEEAKKRLQREVSRMLQLMGKAQVESEGAAVSGTTPTRRGGGGGGYRKLDPLETNDPPTFIEILKDPNKPTKFFPSQRKWLRIETDAPSTYFDPADQKTSKINFILDEHLALVGATALRGGRMRLAVEAKKESVIGASGQIRADLYRPGLPALSDSSSYEIVPPPKEQEKKRVTSFPSFEIIKVEGPEDDRWSNISEESVDAGRHASRATLTEGVLYIYYSAAFPKFAQEFKRWETQDAQKAASFQRRYEVWLAVHALLIQEAETDEEGKSEEEQNDEIAEEFLRQERCRAAVLAAMVASQEVRAGDVLIDASDE